MKYKTEKELFKMPDETLFKTIAVIRNDFSTKFGIPRQSGLVEEVRSVIVFEKEYRNPDALRGLEGFSHLWLLWKFSESDREGFSPTVRPPKLGGNTRMGVFATRSPFRPNPIGLSCVKLEEIKADRNYGTVLVVSGADLMNGTPIFDIKPYLPYSDSRPDASGGFALQTSEGSLEVNFPEKLLELVPEPKRKALTAVLAQDPRPAYQTSPDRVYVMPFGSLEISFCVREGVLTVTKVSET